MRFNNTLKQLYIFVALYAVYDLLNSASAGNDNSNRSVVYVFLVLVVGLMAISLIMGRYISFTSLAKCQCVFLVYYLFNTLILKSKSAWSIFVFAGLTVWWIVTTLFFQKILLKNLTLLVSIQNFVRVMFLFYCFSIVYGSFTISLNYSTVRFARVGYVYHVLAIFPFMLLDRNPKFRKIMIFLAIFLTLFSFKRGAIVILTLMLSMPFFFITRGKIKKSDIFGGVLVLVVVVIAWMIVDNYSGGFLSRRFALNELLDGSGRSETWEIILRNVSQRDFLAMLFGIAGPNEISLDVGAHNEWIGYLNSLGIIGLILFGLIIWNITKTGIQLYRRNSCMASAYISLILYILGVCWVSGFYQVHSTFYVMMFVGCVDALQQYDDAEVRKYIGG